VKLVIDASFAMAWLGREHEGSVLSQFQTRYHAGQVEMHAPELFVIETTNVLWKGVRRRTRTLEESVTMFESLRDLPIQLHRHRDLAVQAFDLSLRRGISAYDATYVALSVRDVLPLFTADMKLASAVEDLIEVVTA
jgi:predicted nucleic acid-binding protein